MSAPRRVEPDHDPGDTAEKFISTMATVCEESFADSLRVLKSDELDGFAAILQEHEKRFVNWTAYLGVFAKDQGSLDQRLKRHPEYRDLIILTLDMLKLNLTQMTAEPSEPSSDESSNEETNRRKDELNGIQKSLNELDRFAIHIRQASTSPLEARVRDFGAKRPEQVSSFDIRATIAVNSLYPDAREDLRKHLSNIMTRTYTKLLYWRFHEKKLRADRRGNKKHRHASPKEPTPRSIPEPSQHQSVEVVPRAAPSASKCKQSLSGTYASELHSHFDPPSLNTPMETIMPVTRRAGASTIVGSGARFPSPPVFAEGEDRQACPLCRKIFFRANFEDSLWWKAHVNEDLTPFACITTTCSESPLFAHRSDWRDHTEKYHVNFENGAPDGIFALGFNDNFTNSCPFCCHPLDKLSSQRFVQFTKHSFGESPNTVPSESNTTAEESIKDTKTVRFAHQASESAGNADDHENTDIMLVNQTKFASSVTTYAVKLMMNHIAEHLQFLTLLIPRLSSGQLEERHIRDFDSFKAISNSHTAGQRSTLVDNDEFADTGNPDEILPSSDAMPQFGEVPVSRSVMYATEDDAGSIDWGDFLGVAVYNEEEDVHINHMKDRISQFNRLLVAVLDWLQSRDSSFEEGSSTIIQRQRSRLLDTQFSDNHTMPRSVAFRSVANGLSLEALQTFFNMALPSQNQEEKGLLVDYCAEQVWSNRSYKTPNSANGERLASRRILFSLLILADQPLDVLWFIKVGISDLDIPLSSQTLGRVVPTWTEEHVSRFVLFQKVSAGNDRDNRDVSEDRPTLHPANREDRHNQYLTFVEHNLSEGVNGYGDRAWFVRPGTLRHWWTAPGGRRIPRLLDSKTFINPTVIIDSYLIIFSILVYIGRAHYIDTFVSQSCEDSQLPLLDSTDKFGSDPLTLEMLTLFRKYQWKFCPVLFSKNMFKKRIDANQILPIMRSINLRGTMDSLKSIIEAVTLYPDCCDSAWAPKDTVVFKQFRTSEDNTLRHAWIRECNALTYIGSWDHTVQYLGSFEQNNRCYVMLEYANGGSLLDLFRKDTRPQTEQEIHRFWMGLMSLLKGINRLHNFKIRAEQRSGFAHRDINPENILVFQDDDDPFSTNFRVKLADFETSTETQIIDAAELVPQDNNGNRTYCAPEASRPHDVQKSDLTQLAFSCDIWSLGCVLVEALVWLAGGWAAVQAAEQERKNTIAASHEHLINDGYGSCFHNGTTVLLCVLASHRGALARLSSTDSVSQRVGELIEHQMLQPSASRATLCMDIWTEFAKLPRGPIGDALYSGPWAPLRPFPSPPTPYSGTTGKPDSPPQQKQHQHYPQPVSRRFHDKIISDVINLRDSTRAREEMPGYELFKLQIQPRHFIILIDDSRSMRAEYQVMDVAESLAWLVKYIDSLGVEVRLTSNPNNRYQSTSKSFRTRMFGLTQPTDNLFKPIREWFRGHKGAGQCNMELALNNIFKEAGVVNPDHPTSVLVLTNGIWQGGNSKGDNIKESIAHVVKRMKDMNMLRTDFTIQFVSFGNDPIGIGRLQYIDDHPPMNSQGETWAIVDHKRHTDNVWEILWGAASDMT